MSICAIAPAGRVIAPAEARGCEHRIGQQRQHGNESAGHEGICEAASTGRADFWHPGVSTLRPLSRSLGQPKNPAHVPGTLPLDPKKLDLE